MSRFAVNVLRTRAQRNVIQVALGMSAKFTKFGLGDPQTPEVPDASKVVNPIDSSELGMYAQSSLKDSDFVIYPRFFDLTEQRILLDACLKRLDDVHGVPAAIRKKRRELLVDQRIQSAKAVESRTASSRPKEPSINDVFLPEYCYEFQDGHFDYVITRFREAPVSGFPMTQTLPTVLKRLNQLSQIHPKIAQMHVLHLASDGHILPHVDNTSASGNTILGVSLGATRIMRMTALPVHGIRSKANDSFSVLLESGSVYIQRDAVRFNFRHEILEKGTFKGKEIEGGQRLSLMMRDSLKTLSETAPLG